MSIFRVFVIVLTCGLAFPSCDRAAPSRNGGPATMAAMGYTFEFEPGSDRDFKIEGHRTATQLSDGVETDLDEDITIRFAGRSVKILNGKLTAEGRDLGAVKPGDRIAIKQTGEVCVNGVKR